MMDATLPTGILRLPTEILRDIFDRFQEGPNVNDPRDLEKYFGYAEATALEHRKTVRVLRLVCRRFCQLASPLLFPTVTVGLDQESLDRVDAISRNPLIAGGIRRIRALLNYCPKELAEDLAQFKDYQLNFLDEVSSVTWYSGYNADPESQAGLAYRDTMDNIWAIRSAWNQYLDPTKEGIGDDKGRAEYQQILCEAHEEYRRKHEEQIRLLTNGSFVSILVSAMSRMPRCGSLIFIDDERLLPRNTPDTQPNVISSKTDLSRFLRMPFCWKTIERLGCTLEPARMLTELPIVVHKAGLTLRELCIGCFPLMVSHDSATDTSFPQRLSSASWDDLRAACQNLEIFEFGAGNITYQPTRKRLSPAALPAFVEEYLRATLSGQQLRNIDVCLHSFGGYPSSSRKADQPAVNSVLDAAILPHIRAVRFSYSALRQDQLDRFCNRLGDGLQDINLSNLQLISGSWIPAMNILRSRFSKQCLEGRCRIYLSDLSGGELEGLVGPAYAGDDPFLNGNWGLLEDPPIFEELQKYVTGVGGPENPLKPQ